MSLKNWVPWVDVLHFSIERANKSPPSPWHQPQEVIKAPQATPKGSCALCAVRGINIESTVTLFLCETGANSYVI